MEGILSQGQSMLAEERIPSAHGTGPVGLPAPRHRQRVRRLEETNRANILSESAKDIPAGNGTATVGIHGLAKAAEVDNARLSR